MTSFNYGIELAPIDYDDQDMLRMWRNDPRIMRWTRQSDIINEQEQMTWYNSLKIDKSKRMYMIRSGGLPIGVCGFTSIDMQNQRAEFSLYIEPYSQKKGHATAALKTLFKHGFHNLNFNLIWGETFDKNPAEKLFKKIGMKLEGTRRCFYFKNGKYIDAHIYSLLRSEWKS